MCKFVSALHTFKSVKFFCHSGCQVKTVYRKVTQTTRGAACWEGGVSKLWLGRIPRWGWATPFKHLQWSEGMGNNSSMFIKWDGSITTSNFTPNEKIYNTLLYKLGWMVFVCLQWWFEYFLRQSLTIYQSRQTRCDVMTKDISQATATRMKSTWPLLVLEWFCPTPSLHVPFDRGKKKYRKAY